MSNLDGTTVYSSGGEDFCLIEWDVLAGEPICNYWSLLQSDISGLVFSPSPDRLWASSTEGVVCWIELKRGKKTQARLHGSAGADQSTPSVSQLHPQIVEEQLGIINNEQPAVDQYEKDDPSAIPISGVTPTQIGPAGSSSLVTSEFSFEFSSDEETDSPLSSPREETLAKTLDKDDFMIPEVVHTQEIDTNDNELDSPAHSGAPEPLTQAQPSASAGGWKIAQPKRVLNM
jgi:hypothetical protein